MQLAHCICISFAKYNGTKLYNHGMEGVGNGVCSPQIQTLLYR